MLEYNIFGNNQAVLMTLFMFSLYPEVKCSVYDQEQHYKMGTTLP